MAPKGSSTRPTTDRVKESVFSIIGPFFDGGRCLDLFAGSGALGIESISRGMAEAVFVDRVSTEVVQQNLDLLGIREGTIVLRMHYEAALRKLMRESMRFDLVFLDPPYSAGVVPAVLVALCEGELLNNSATVVVEMDRRDRIPDCKGVRLRREVVYGDTRICVYDKDVREAEPHADSGVSGEF